MNAKRRRFDCSDINPITNNMEEEEEEIRSYMSELPTDMIMYILCRLPIKNIFRCRSVCKAWRDLLLEPDFLNLHHTQAPTALMLQLVSRNIENPKNLCMVEVEDRLVHSHGVVKKNLDNEADNNVPRPIFVIGNSCNGLVCVCEHISLNPVYIWNPIMGEYVTLPHATSLSGFYSVSGLGFSPMTKEYKVIRILIPRNAEQALSHKWEAEICTLGMETTWRSIGDAPYPLHCPSLFTFLNGALHWLVMGGHENAGMICSFDIGSEQFRLIIPPPAIFSPNNKKKIHWSNLGVLQGCLYMCASDAEVFRPDVEIWVMKDYGIKESWVKELAIKDPIVEWWNPNRRFQLVKILKSGEILVLCGCRLLFSYNPRDRTSVNLKESGFGVTAHVPSFVSLKDVVMGDNNEVFNVKSV